MTLSDGDILREFKSGNLVVTPFDEKNLQPASIDLFLGNQFKYFKNVHIPFIDVKKPVSDLMETIEVKDNQPLIIHPREFLLGHTIEHFKFPDYLIGRLEGKSSLGRLGLVVHVTAGFFDPGFEGQATLEITNLSNLPLAIYPGMKICQMSFFRLETPAKTPYGSKKLGSKYKGQLGATASQLHKNF